MRSHARSAFNLSDYLAAEIAVVAPDGLIVHGHIADDAAIKSLAATVVELADSDSLVARIGGDEFGVVLPVRDQPGLTSPLEATIAAGIVSTIHSEGQTLAVRASAGGTYYPLDGDSATGLLTAADRSMYTHKRHAGLA